MAEPTVSRIFPMSLQAAKQLQELAANEDMMAIDSQENFAEYNDTDLLALFRNFRTLEEIKRGETKKTDKKENVEGQKILTVQEVEDAAGRYQRSNEELRAKTLLILRSSITAEDNAEEILNKTLRIYADHALADEAIDFIIETTRDDVQRTAKIAKEQLNENFKREIQAGRNMGAQAREFSKEGLGSPTSLRDLYRDITGTPREPLKLFEELTEKFRYDKLATIITFLLHSLGSDLKSKGPSIPRGELKRLIDETRSLQGIIGIFRFFKSRMRLMQRLFVSYNLVFPPRLNFEVLSRVFVKILSERFVNPDKLQQVAKVLGLAEEIEAQMVIFTQYRDALKHIAPRYYRNPQHRDELLKTFIHTIEDLEDTIEEEKEDEEREKRKREKERKKKP